MALPLLQTLCLQVKPVAKGTIDTALAFLRPDLLVRTCKFHYTNLGQSPKRNYPPCYAEASSTCSRSVQALRALFCLGMTGAMCDMIYKGRIPLFCPSFRSQGYITLSTNTQDLPHTA